MRILTILAASAALFFAACTHRPYYRDLVGATTTEKEVSFILKNASNGEPLAGVPVRVSSGNDRVAVTTDKSGKFTLPVKRGLMDPYTVVDVVRPSGVTAYTIEKIVPPAEGQPSTTGT